jgi:hypothetical protein
MDEKLRHQRDILSCGVIEAGITDARLHYGSRIGDGRSIAGWSFEVRIDAAERAGLIRSGCARLPAAARRCKDLTDADGQLRPEAAVSERDARVVGQVLRVVM